MKLKPIKENIQRRKHTLPIMWACVSLITAFGIISYNYFDYKDGTFFFIAFPVGLLLHLYISRRLKTLETHTVTKDLEAPAPERETIRLPWLRPEESIKRKKGIQSFCIFIVIVAVIQLNNPGIKDAGIAYCLLLIIGSVVLFASNRKSLLKEQESMKKQTYEGPDIILEEEGLSLNDKLVIGYMSLPDQSNGPLIKIPWPSIK